MTGGADSMCQLSRPSLLLARVRETKARQPALKASRSRVGFRWLAYGRVDSANWIPWIPQRIQRAKIVSQQAFDIESLFLTPRAKWIPPGFPGETACR